MRGISFLLVFWIGFEGAAAQQMDQVQIRTEKVREGIYMLAGRGGNIGVSAGKDGVFLIDDEFAPLTEKIVAAIRAISPRPIRFLLNTHWHGDHTGGNENLGRAGILIVAHDNVRRRLASGQFIQALKRHIPPSPPAALPVVTYDSAVTFHMNGDEIHAFHVAPAHTDGDSVIQFRRSNVFHMGDLFFNGTYPFIDLASGGSVNGMIAAAERVLPLTDAETKIIPGHGPLGGRAELQAFHDMLVQVRDRVQALMGQGRTLDETLAAHPTADLDARWGKGFIQGDAFTRTVYTSLKQ